MLRFFKDPNVWRAFFIAVSIMLIIVGVECLFIDSATFGAAKKESIQVSNGWFSQPTVVDQIRGGRTVDPPDWVPWSFLFSGTVVLLYSFTLPGRWKSAG